MTQLRVTDPTGKESLARIVRASPKIVHLETSDKLLHACLRRTGKPWGTRSCLTIHPDDLHLVEAVEATAAPKTKSSTKRGRGVPPGWLV